jgi:hypothetical protein
MGDRPGLEQSFSWDCQITLSNYHGHQIIGKVFMACTFLARLRLMRLGLSAGLMLATIGIGQEFAQACTDDQCLQQRQWAEENLQQAIEFQRRQQEEWEWEWEQQQQQYVPPPPKPDNPWIPLIGYPVNAALVWWHDSDQNPGFSLAVRRYSVLNAMDDAMNHCFMRGGQGCRVALVTSASWIAVAQGADGGLYAAEGGKEDEAREEALNRCESSSQNCAIAAITQNNK